MLFVYVIIRLKSLNQIFIHKFTIMNKNCSFVESEQKKFFNHLFADHLTMNLLCLSPVEEDSLTSNNLPPSTDLEYQILVLQQPSLRL